MVTASGSSRTPSMPTNKSPSPVMSLRLFRRLGNANSCGSTASFIGGLQQSLSMMMPWILTIINQTVFQLIFRPKTLDNFQKFELAMLPWSLACSGRAHQTWSTSPNVLSKMRAGEENCPAHYCSVSGRWTYVEYQLSDTRKVQLSSKLIVKIDLPVIFNKEEW